MTVSKRDLIIGLILGGILVFFVANLIPSVIADRTLSCIDGSSPVFSTNDAYFTRGDLFSTTTGLVIQNPKAEQITFGNHNGISMLPTLPSSSMTLRIEATSENVRIGDIITFAESDGKSIMHRVVDIFEVNGTTLYQTRGDNNVRADSQNITFNQIEHKIVGVLY